MGYVSIVKVDLKPFLFPKLEIQNNISFISDDSLNVLRKLKKKEICIKQSSICKVKGNFENVLAS